MEMQIKAYDGQEGSFHVMSNNVTASERQLILKVGVPMSIRFPGLRPIKQAELYNNFRRYIPAEYQDELCPMPPIEVLENQRKERSDRAKSKRSMKRKSSQTNCD
jgi:hypothetical protein